MAVTAGPAFDEMVELLPAAQVEIADAEIRAVGDLQRLLQRGQKVLARCCQRCGASLWPLLGATVLLDTWQQRLWVIFYRAAVALAIAVTTR